MSVSWYVPGRSVPHNVVMERLDALARARTAGVPHRACIYCGAPTYGLACSKHWDLVRNDPYFRHSGEVQ